MFEKQFEQFFNADGGEAGGAGQTDPPKEQTPGADEGQQGAKQAKPDFTEEQNSHIQKLIDAALAKGAAKAKKDMQKESQTGAESLESEKKAIARERSLLKATTLLTKEGFLIDGDDGNGFNDLLSAMVADSEDKISAQKLDAVKKLIETQVNKEVDKRLRGAKNSPPDTGSKNSSVGQTINDSLRGTIIKGD
jgi:hypothetical protein